MKMRQNDSKTRQKLAGHWPARSNQTILVLEFGNDDIDPTKVSREAK